jgi:hypothetical protein
LDSYASELGIDFMITLEANHVIPANRVWIASISQGPKNTILNGSYKTTSSFEYQVNVRFYVVVTVAFTYFSLLIQGRIRARDVIRMSDHSARSLVFLALLQSAGEVCCSMAGHGSVATTLDSQNPCV